jgi:hypothetical protein
MDSSTLLYLAGFFFVLGAGIVGFIWIIVALVRGFLGKGKASSSQEPNLSVLARLLRDMKTQNLVVEMDGKTFTAMSELSPAQQKRLGIISSVLAKWLSLPTPIAAQLSSDQSSSDQPSPAAMAVGMEAVVSAVTPEPAIQPAPVIQPVPAAEVDTHGFNQQPDLNDWIPAEAVPTETTDHHIPPFTVQTTPEVKPVSTDLPDVLGGILTPTQAPAPVYKSIAMQINDILQVRISGTPFERRGISVSDGPDHGVLVTLDGQKFPGVKDVPDDDVRNLIRSSVLEWEKQSKPSSK